MTTATATDAPLGAEVLVSSKLLGRARIAGERLSPDEVAQISGKMQVGAQDQQRPKALLRRGPGWKPP